MEHNGHETRPVTSDEPLDIYLDTTRYLLENVVADRGPAFEAYLDEVAPEHHVEDLTDDFARRFYGDYASEDEVIESLMGERYLAKHSYAELWEHIEAIYDITYHRDGRIYLFIPTPEARHG